MEPGIFGLVRPALLWPQAISARLEEAHLEAVLAHEVRHVRRRDNLTAVFHMLVEAIFWFHPLLWWLEKRLVEEREYACDEEISLRCGQPQIYAESILRVCGSASNRR
jgi:beta-lactamase regulating signal transducer with metallopeptidase domain